MQKLNLQSANFFSLSCPEAVDVETAFPSLSLNWEIEKGKILVGTNGSDLLFCRRRDYGIGDSNDKKEIFR